MPKPTIKKNSSHPTLNNKWLLQLVSKMFLSTLFSSQDKRLIALNETRDGELNSVWLMVRFSI